MHYHCHNIFRIVRGGDQVASAIESRVNRREEGGGVGLVVDRV